MRAEEQPPQRRFSIAATPAIRQLDTLTIIPGTFRIFDAQGQELNDAFFELNPVTTFLRLILPDDFENDSLRVEYQVWPFNLAAPVFLRDTSLIRTPGLGEELIFETFGSPLPDQGLISFEGLESSGSITRGLTLGNRQNPVLKSAMNLQLNGALTDQISILAVVSDQNIPFQPDGTTQQLQDFDKVFIKLDGYGASLTAGDFEMGRAPGHFLNMSRKLRGGMVSWDSEKSDSAIIFGGRLSAIAAGAIARGKYARNSIQGVEGNQGPYRLMGSQNESFILILAGTERIFIDGRLMQRGMDRDYVIDYNTAELSFMPRIKITRDSRIIAEFEYAERNFARSAIFTGATLSYKKATVRINFFSEQDHPNQPLFQELSGERRALMASVGDSIHKATDLQFDSITFRNNRVMYRLVDSLGYEKVFVYSIDPAQAFYQPVFTQVGQGNGNYRQINSAANGRVFAWVEPVNGISQGTHEPVVLLVTPRKQQMLTLRGDAVVTNTISTRWEYALSNLDINLFSDMDKKDNLGHAFMIETNGLWGGKSVENWKWKSNLSWEYTSKQFNAIERFREVEFERDWNLPPKLARAEGHLPALMLSGEKSGLFTARYSLKSLLLGQQYQGVMNVLETSFTPRNQLLYYAGSILATSGQASSHFYRHRSGGESSFGFVRIGIEHLIEQNRRFDANGAGLSLLSNWFNQAEFYLAQPATFSDEYRLFYRVRSDKLPVGKSFYDASRSQDYGLHYQLNRFSNHRLAIQLIYRELEVTKVRFAGEKNERTINARGDYTARLAKGAITSTLFYETASGRERKREFIYIEVPPGQGVYIWIDYNGNNIMELDEFELSPFPDEANFIRVFVPVEEFVPVYSSSISHTLNFDPAVVWRNKEGLRKFVSLFSNRLNYRINNKRQGGMAWENFNPFFTNISDTVLITLGASLRNSLFFNRNNPRYSLEWTLQDNRNKNLLSNGFESRSNRSNGLRLRYNFSTQYSFLAWLEEGERKSESEFFANRNFTIRQKMAEPSVNYQPNLRTRFSFMYGFQFQENITGGEQARTQRITFENRTNSPNRGTIQLRYQVQRISYDNDPNSPLAFDMLQGLRPGINHLWHVNWQQNLNAFLQLSLIYNGRKPPGVTTIHTGTVQLRALF